VLVSVLWALVYSRLWHRGMLDFHTEEQCIYTFAPTPAVFPLLQTVSRSERSFSCLVQKFLPVSLLIYTILHCSTCICNASTGRPPCEHFPVRTFVYNYSLLLFIPMLHAHMHSCCMLQCCHAAMQKMHNWNMGITGKSGSH
jgi:hypothetical protein